MCSPMSIISIDEQLLTQISDHHIFLQACESLRDKLRKNVGPQGFNRASIGPSQRSPVKDSVGVPTAPAWKATREAVRKLPHGKHGINGDALDIRHDHMGHLKV